MSLSLTPLPANVGAFTLLPNTDPSTGIVTMTARPARRAYTISQALLQSLGTSEDVFGSGRRHDQDLLLLHAWLRAYDVTTVVIRHATNITDKTLLDNLMHICDAIGAHLALACDDTVTTRLNDWVEERGGTIHTGHEPLLALIEEHARPGATVTPSAGVDFPQFLPRIDFYGFRARCRDVLTPAEFAALDSLYVTAFQEVRADPYGTVDEAVNRLAAAIANHRTPGEVLTITRAAQAAMFTHGLLLKVDVPTMLNGVRDSRHRRLTPQEVRALRAYRTPWRSTAVVLRDADLTMDEIHAVTLDQVRPDGTISGFPDMLPLHPDALVYVRAQRAYRLSLGATPDEPLIDNTRAHVKRALRLAGSELNLPTSGNHERSNERKSSHWKRGLGVALLPLITTHLPSSADIKKAA